MPDEQTLEEQLVEDAALEPLMDFVAVVLSDAMGDKPARLQRERDAGRAGYTVDLPCGASAK